MSNRGHSAPCFLDVTKEARKGGRGGHGNPGGGRRDKKLGHYTTTDIKRNRHLRALYFSVLHVVANAYLRE